jgi:adenosylcobinamide-phosphate synthase
MTPIIFFGTYVADMIIGDPRWLPHPVEMIGRLISFLENRIRLKGDGRFIDQRKGGIVLWFAVTVSSYCVTLAIVEGSFMINAVFGAIISVLVGSFTLATRSLYGQSRDVVDSLRLGNIEEARRNLSIIVGRDTETLDEESIIRAVIETVAENLSDGIIAPMFYMIIGGVPLAMVYKAVNTLDSMVGYKNERYRDIGWFSAKMDDIFNWVPARLAGIIIVAVSFILRFNGRDSWKVMRRDGKNHSSPNSGVPEAAMAGALSVQLGGENTYWGEIVTKPTIGDKIKKTDREAVTKAWIIMFASSLLMLVIGVTIVWIIE